MVPRDSNRLGVDMAAEMAVVDMVTVAMEAATAGRNVAAVVTTAVVAVTTVVVAATTAVVAGIRTIANEMGSHRLTAEDMVVTVKAVTTRVV
eukprot:768746-Hanusia_phi.AAC.3